MALFPNVKYLAPTTFIFVKLRPVVKVVYCLQVSLIFWKRDQPFDLSLGKDSAYIVTFLSPGVFPAAGSSLSLRNRSHVDRP